MPHIIFEKNKELTTPSSIEGVDFSFLSKGKSQDKIGVKYKNKEFLLTLKNHEDKFIIKADKATRVTPNDYIKTALNSFIEITNSKEILSNTTIKKTKVKPEEEYLKDINYFVNEFKTTKDIAVEIGFGSGRHLLHQAKNNPDTIFIGIEIHFPSIEQALKQLKLQNITNVLILNYDARLFMEFLPSNSVSKIYVHFPVPWDKKPHRRVYSPEFVKESLRVLNNSGALELRSDSENYFQYCLGLLTSLMQGHIEIDINKNPAITSKYEDRWLRQEKKIYDLKLYCDFNSKQKILNKDFSFDNGIKFEKIKDKIEMKKPITTKDFFVHFEYMYEIDETSGLIELTFGSFNRPLSKFIYFSKDGISYFQEDPIPTSANIEAHKFINEYLKGLC